MAAGPSFLLVLLTLLTGNGTDLLDYVPTQDYWQAKGVTVSTKVLLDELQPPKPGADITKLIAAMGAGNAAARDEAAKKIQAMGPGVVPQLQKAARLDDPEISLRAKQLIQQINQSQKAASVRRLMAIRTLGETKAKEALPALQGLSKSDEPFVADYAAAAAAAIEGKPYDRPHAKSGSDAWLVPEGCRLVAHLSARGGGPVDFDAAMKGMAGFGAPPPPPPPPGAGPAGAAGAPAGPDPAAMRKQIVTQILAVAEKTGNIRFDGATVGLSGEIGPHNGSVVAIVHAQYDAAAVAELIASGGAGMKVESKVVNGTTVFQPEKQVSFAFPSNDRAFLVGGPTEQPLPIEEVEAAVRTGAGKLKNVESMAKLIKALDVEQPLWAVAEMTPAYKQAPVLAPFDTIKLTGKPAKAADGNGGDKVDFILEAVGKDANQVNQAVAQVNQGINQAKAELSQAAQHVPPGFGPMLQAATEVVNSIQCAPDPKDGKVAKLTGTAPMTSPAMLLMMFGGVARAEPAPAAVQERAIAVPAQPEPQRKP